MQLRGQLQSDNDYQPTHDILFLASSELGGAYTQTFQAANQQDHWGYEVTGKPRFDARTETSLGTLRAYVELKIQLDAGAFNAVVAPGQGETGAGNKPEFYRGYLQWAGWTIGEADSIWSLGAFTTLGANRASNSGNIQFEVLYANGALEYGGVGGTMGSLGAGDAYWTGGLARDDTDARLVNNDAGGYFYDKEKDLVVNGQSTRS